MLQAQIKQPDRAPECEECGGEMLVEGDYHGNTWMHCGECGAIRDVEDG